MSTKNILSAIAFGMLLVLLITVISMKDKMNDFVSVSLQNQLSEKAKSDGRHLIDSLYNYTVNGEDFRLTFIEFGAEGCISCRKMKQVMEKVEEMHSNQVKVVFLNTLREENQQLMKMFGIASIPAQVLLDDTGREYYRHSGYISYEELRTQFK